MSWQRVANVDEVVEGEALPVAVGKTLLALVRSEGQVFCIDNVCTHEFALLSDGIVEDGCIECPLHSARFDVATGEHRSGPACEHLRTYPVQIADGDGLVALDR